MCLGAININPRGFTGKFQGPLSSLSLDFLGSHRVHLKILCCKITDLLIVALSPWARLLPPRCLSALMGQQLPSAGRSGSLLSVWEKEKKKKRPKWHGGFLICSHRSFYIRRRACAHNCSWRAASLLRSSAGQMLFTTAL